VTTPRDELIARLDAAWADFAGQVKRLPRERFDALTPAGWTITAMLSHIAAWHDATTYRLSRFAATGKQQPTVEPDDRAFNARVAAEAAGLPPEHVVQTLEASARRLRDAIVELPPGLDEEGWIEAVVGGNSFDHYDEHREELDVHIGGPSASGPSFGRPTREPTSTFRPIPSTRSASEDEPR
jgi:hypothetical protein